MCRSVSAQSAGAELSPRRRRVGLRPAAEPGGRHHAASEVLFVGIGRAELAIGIAFILVPALGFRLALLLLLAVAAQAGKRHRVEAFFGDFETAGLADAVASLVDE